MNAIASGVGWSLLSTVIVFTALFLIHFCYVTPKRMLAEITNELELANTRADQLMKERNAIQLELTGKREQSQRHILLEMTTLLQEKAPPAGGGAPYVPTKIYDPIGALIAVSEQFNTEQDVIDACHSLAEADYGDPFSYLELLLPPNLFHGKRLKFIKDAKLNQEPIKTEKQAYDFFCNFWADRNGITLPNEVRISDILKGNWS